MQTVEVILALKETMGDASYADVLKRIGKTQPELLLEDGVYDGVDASYIEPVAIDYPYNGNPFPSKLSEEEFTRRIFERLTLQSISILMRNNLLPSIYHAKVLEQLLILGNASDQIPFKSYSAQMNLSYDALKVLMQPRFEGLQNLHVYIERPEIDADTFKAYLKTVQRVADLEIDNFSFPTEVESRLVIQKFLILHDYLVEKAYRTPDNVLKSIYRGILQYPSLSNAEFLNTIRQRIMALRVGRTEQDLYKTPFGIALSYEDRQFLNMVWDRHSDLLITPTLLLQLRDEHYSVIAKTRFYNEMLERIAYEESVGAAIVVPHYHHNVAARIIKDAMGTNIFKFHFYNNSAEDAEEFIAQLIQADVKLSATGSVFSLTPFPFAKCEDLPHYGCNDQTIVNIIIKNGKEAMNGIHLEKIINATAKQKLKLWLLKGTL